MKNFVVFRKEKKTIRGRWEQNNRNKKNLYLDKAIMSKI